ncbi:MAG: hypothetical protein A2Z29_06625 [Chloroflexi bacterium RBG_16_56_11]|nr:MAG: hypothetical protein A2Z29_06625 [Chloroflexi bacterium RBG_16_56_11]
MLYCDVLGDVHTSRPDRSVTRLAREIASRKARLQQPFVTVGLETTPGRYIPVIVAVGTGEARRLERIAELALRSGKLPAALKRHIRPFTRLAAASYETAVPAGGRKKCLEPPEIMTVLMEKPPFPERDIEITMPVYKADYRYPLIALKILPPDTQTLPGMARLLTLDGEGDLAVIGLTDRLARGVKSNIEGSNGDRPLVSVLTAEKATGNSLEHMQVTRHQQESLVSLVKHYEKTGHSRQPLSLAAQSVVTGATLFLAA